MLRKIIKILCAISFFISFANSYAFTANKVWFEFRPNGAYRVYVNYTIPALKEMREAYVDFNKKKEAEVYYWDLVKGADFYLPDSKNHKFVDPPSESDPW